MTENNDVYRPIHMGGRALHEVLAAKLTALNKAMLDALVARIPAYR